MPRQNQQGTRAGQLAGHGVGTHFTTPKKSRRAARHQQTYKPLAHERRVRQLEAELDAGLDALNWIGEDEEGTSAQPEVESSQHHCQNQPSLQQDVVDECRDTRDMDMYTEDPARMNGNGDRDDWIDVDAGMADNSAASYQHFNHDVGRWVARQAQYRRPRRIVPSDEKQHLYENWRALIPRLVYPLLEYEEKSSGRPAMTEADIDWMPPLCMHLNCERSTSVVTCLFWDRKPYHIF